MHNNVLTIIPTCVFLKHTVMATEAPLLECDELDDYIEDVLHHKQVRLSKDEERICNMATD